MTLQVCNSHSNSVYVVFGGIITVHVKRHSMLYHAKREGLGHYVNDVQEVALSPGSAEAEGIAIAVT